MSTHAPTGGLRPALPPTLQPLALALAAPRPDRRLALLASAVVYLFIPAALMALGKVVPKLPEPRPTKPDEIIESRDVVLGGFVQPKGASPVAPPRAEPAAQTRTEPKAVEEPANQATPDRLDLTDRSSLNAGTAKGDGSGHQVDGPGIPEGDPRVRTLPPSNLPAVELASDAVRILHQTVPPYPAAARATRQQGDVLVRMIIDPRGVPTSVHVEQGPPLLRAAAEQAARQWRFSPAQVNGLAVPATFLLTLKFRLQ
jgi:protein TonB